MEYVITISTGIFIFMLGVMYGTWASISRSKKRREYPVEREVNHE